MPVDGSLIGVEILQGTGPGVTRADQDINTSPPFPGNIDERFERVTAEIGVDRQCIGTPNRSVHIRPAQVGPGIGLGRRSDITSLGITDDDQPGLPRAADDPLAVVDPELRVIGVDGRRVADSSIFPRITNGNLNAPSIMTGEKAADHILGRQMLREKPA